MLIRQASASDLDAVFSIEASAQIASWSRQSFDDCLQAHYLFYVLVLDDQIRGFLIASTVLDEVHILNVCIHPQFQNQGFGRKLLNFFLELMTQQKKRYYYLEVRASNLSAIHLYHALGFHEIDQRKGYYLKKTGREDAIVMALDKGYFEEKS